MWNKYIERKYKYSIGKRVLNVSLTAKVLGWRELNTEMNILPVFIVIGRVHYSPLVGTIIEVKAVYHETDN